MLTMGFKFNRSYNIHLPFKGDYTTTKVFFNKTNTNLGFVTDDRISRLYRNGDVKTQIYKDLRKSSFSNTFLDISSFNGPHLDIRNQFSNIQEKYKQKIQYLGNETIKLCKVKSSNGKELESCLYMYMFGFADYEGDFIYIIAERQHIDISIDKKLVRSCSLQIATPECINNMNEMVSYYNGSIESELNMTESDTDNEIEHLFDSVDNHTTHSNHKTSNKTNYSDIPGIGNVKVRTI